MFKAIYSFFMDEVTFKRAVADGVTFGGPVVALATNPTVAENLAILGVQSSPKVQAVAIIASLVGAVFSARTRQMQEPPVQP